MVMMVYGDGACYHNQASHTIRCMMLYNTHKQTHTGEAMVIGYAITSSTSYLLYKVADTLWSTMYTLFTLPLTGMTTIVQWHLEPLTMVQVEVGFVYACVYMHACMNRCICVGVHACGGACLCVYSGCVESGHVGSCKTPPYSQYT